MGRWWMSTSDEIWNQIDRQLAKLKLTGAFEDHREETADGVRQIRQRYSNNAGVACNPRPVLREVFRYLVAQEKTWIKSQGKIYEQVWKAQGNQETPQFLRALSEKITFLRPNRDAQAKMLQKELGSLAPPAPLLMNAFISRLQGQFAIAERASRRSIEIAAMELDYAAIHREDHAPKVEPSSPRKVERKNRDRGRPQEEHVEKRRKILQRIMKRDPKALSDPKKLLSLFAALEKAQIAIPGNSNRSTKWLELFDDPMRKKELDAVLRTLRMDFERS
jgi:hypothetical protein